MSRAPLFRLAFSVSCLIPTVLSAQVPAELRELMRTRDEAIAKADGPTWDRLTADGFTVVLADGVLRTKRSGRPSSRRHTPPPGCQRSKSRSSRTAMWWYAGPCATSPIPVPRGSSTSG
jgi:hypothetical protein